MGIWEASIPMFQRSSLVLPKTAVIGREKVASGKPPACRHSLLHVLTMRFGREWQFPPMAAVVAIPAGGNDVVGCIPPTFGAWVEMLGSAAQALHRRFRSLLSRSCSGCIVPHQQVAVIAASPLGDHLFSADVLQCSHGTGPSFDFVRSECAASLGTLPGRKLLLARDPIVRGSAVRMTKSDG